MSEEMPLVQQVRAQAKGTSSERNPKQSQYAGGAQPRGSDYPNTSCDIACRPVNPAGANSIHCTASWNGVWAACQQLLLQVAWLASVR